MLINNKSQVIASTVFNVQFLFHYCISYIAYSAGFVLGFQRNFSLVLEGTNALSLKFIAKHMLFSLSFFGGKTKLFSLSQSNTPPNLFLQPC